MSDLAQHVVRPLTEVEVIDQPAQAEWDLFVERQPDACGYHPWVWTDIIRSSLNLRVFNLAVRRGNEIVGVLPLVRQRLWPLPATLISLPFVNYAGLLCPDPEAEQALLAAARDLARRNRVGRIELRHDRQRAAAWGLREDKVRVRIDTTGSEEAIWAALPGQRRTQIRKARKSGLEEQVGGEELLDEFYRLVSRKWRDLGSPVLPRRFFSEILQRLPDSTRICLVRVGRRTAAAGFIYRFRDRVENPWVGSLPELASTRANVLLYWIMIRESRRWEASSFDFGRSTRDSGNHAFKSRWKGIEEALPWSVWPATAGQGAQSGSAAALLKTVWKKLPMPLANRLGPLLSPHLPL